MSNTTPDILIVDDDAELTEMLASYLTERGFHVRTAADGREMRLRLSEAKPDLILLDLMLPGEDGLSLARTQLAQSTTPIIMFSARGESVDRVIGLELGCDDYVAKPFDPRELQARIKAVLRRHAAPTQGVDDNPLLCFGPYQLNIAEHRLTRAGEVIALTTGEFTLLSVFARNPRKVLSRDRLLTLIEGDERLPFDRSIDVRVARLRRKIELDADQPAYIRTVWGVGYLFSPHATDE